MEILQIVLYILALMVAFILGGAYGWDLRERQASRRLEEISRAVESKIADEIKNVIHITVEKHNGMLFVYDKKNHNFMAQGSTPTELEKNLSERYPGKKFACSAEQMKLLEA